MTVLAAQKEVGMTEASREQVRRALLEELEEGQVCRGVVSAVEGFGAFVDIGGLDGLVNVAELTWAHFEAVSDVVEIGQEVTVVVLGVDLDREQCALSLKALHPDPFPEFARTQLGRVVTGRVEKLVSIGAFVRINEYRAGLVPMHDLEARTAGALQVGDEVTVEVAAINLWKRRILLSLRP
ncbi:S1 RNA-binding domain-containing protein [Streptomyces sp. N35]|uniref:S1 RNA-binding domain-containing protein n=1 Tax=Streptomyces sp. N35 TaxID=2795730 RepID=UPI0018F60E9D|nr:S1 RNA-binding domain-containing protein [Streptomyces sp. N35]